MLWQLIEKLRAEMEFRRTKREMAQRANTRLIRALLKMGALQRVA